MKTNQKNNFYFKQGIDSKLFWSMYFLYRPFLSSQYFNRTLSYTIYNERNEIEGFINLKTDSWAIQIAFVPNKTLDSLSVIRKFIQDMKLEGISIEWTIHKANYPSAILLKKLFGIFTKTEGVVEKGYFSCDKDDYYKIGYLCFGSNKKVIRKSKKLFKKWLVKFNKRVELKQELETYLKVLNKGK